MGAIKWCFGDLQCYNAILRTRKIGIAPHFAAMMGLTTATETALRTESEMFHVIVVHVEFGFVPCLLSVSIHWFGRECCSPGDPVVRY